MARARRWPIAAGETRKAEAIAAASRPNIVCSMSGARMDSSIAGWAQANMSARRRSGIDVSSSAAFSSSSIIASASDRRLRASPAAGGVDHAPSRRRHEPALGIGRHAAAPAMRSAPRRRRRRARLRRRARRGSARRDRRRACRSFRAPSGRRRRGRRRRGPARARDPLSSIPFTRPHAPNLQLHESRSLVRRRERLEENNPDVLGPFPFPELNLFRLLQ